MNKTYAIIQARMSSERLPGKVLVGLAGKPLLGHIVERLDRAKLLDGVLVATSNESSDDPIAEYCKAAGINCFRGSLNNVLERYLSAAQYAGAKNIVRVTGDCPLIDPQVVDSVVHEFINGNCDYASNCFRRLFPRGLDTEITSRSLLEDISQLPLEAKYREHVTLYIYENAGRYRVANVEPEDRLCHPEWRWCVDEPADLALMESIFNELYTAKPNFESLDVVEFLERNPELIELNRAVEQKAH